MPQDCDRLVIGTGYLGFRVARAWQQAGFRTAVTTRSPERANEFRQQGLHPVLCNVLDPASLQQLPTAQVILHAVGYDRSSGQSQREVYVSGLQNILQTVRQRCGRLIHISSTSVYGQTEGEWVDESSANEPARENGQIVLDAEQVLRDSDCDWQILRLAGIYGPHRLLARKNERQQNLPIPGNPEAWLNLIHVDDCVQAVLAAAKISVSRQTFLIADDQPIRRREYYETLARLLQTPPPQFEPDQADPKGDRGLNKRISNQKMHADLLKDLLFPTIHQGLPNALDS